MPVNLFEKDIKVKGGVCGAVLKIVHTKNISNWPEQKNLKQLSAISLVNDAEWFSIPFIPRTLSPQEATVANGSKLYAQVIPGSINNIDSAKRKTLLDYEDEPVILIFTHPESGSYVVGSPLHPAYITITNRNVNAVVSGGSKMSFVASCASKLPYLNTYN